MEAARAAKTIDFNKEFRIGLDVQRAEIEAQKLVEKEKFESELALRRSLEAALKDQVYNYNTYLVLLTYFYNLQFEFFGQLISNFTGNERGRPKKVQNVGHATTNVC